MGVLLPACRQQKVLSLDRPACSTTIMVLAKTTPPEQAESVDNQEVLFLGHGQTVALFGWERHNAISDGEGCDTPSCEN
jgi:hypothetical protein